MTPVFKHGDLRLYLLGALEEQARHGYELITLLETRLLGLYRPSAGTIYPRLAALEDEGLVTHHETNGRKAFELTAAGRAEVDARRGELGALQNELKRSAAEALRDARTEIRTSVRNLRSEMRTAVTDIRRQDRRTEREAADRRSAAGSGDEHARAVRALQVELGAFSADVTAAARRYRSFTRADLGAIAAALNEARAAAFAALANTESRD